MIDRVTILGGSSVYIPEFVVSMLAHNLLIRELVLVGKGEKKTEMVASLCQRLVNKNGYATTVIPETDVREAVAGASYIINHVRVGGMKARMRDEMLPPQLDMIGSDSLGAGAVLNALRTLPVVFDFARIIEEVNPQAPFINLTNPVGIIVQALKQHSGLNVVGISDLPAIYQQKIAELLGRDVDDVQINYVGLHDIGWIQDVRVDGVSRMSHLLETLEGTEDDQFDHTLINLFRMIPTRSMGLYFHRQEVLKQQQSCSRFRSEVLFDAEKRILRLYANSSLNAVPDLTRQRNALWYDNTLIPLLQAFESNAPTTMVLCLENGGAITDLANDCSVEVPVCITRHKLKTRKVGMLPRFLRGVFCSIKESDRLVIKAVRHKSYDYALQALVVNPFVPSVSKARELLDRAIRQDHFELH